MKCNISSIHIHLWLSRDHMQHVNRTLRMAKTLDVVVFLSTGNVSYLSTRFEIDDTCSQAKENSWMKHSWSFVFVSFWNIPSERKKLCHFQEHVFLLFLYILFLIHLLGILWTLKKVRNVNRKVSEFSFMSKIYFEYNFRLFCFRCFFLSEGSPSDYPLELRYHQRNSYSRKVTCELSAYISTK